MDIIGLMVEGVGGGGGGDKVDEWPRRRAWGGEVLPGFDACILIVSITTAIAIAGSWKKWF